MNKIRLCDDPVVTGPLLFAASVFGRFLVASAFSRKSLITRSIHSQPTASVTINKPAAVVANKLLPPVAQKIFTDVYHGVDPTDADKEVGDNPMNPPIIRKDPYYWLRDDDRKDPKVIDYLEKENAYFFQETEHLKPFQEQLYNEMVSHLKETDEDVPYKHDNYYYYSKTIKGKPYKIHCRKPIIVVQQPENIVGLEEVILDENEVAAGKDYCDINEIEISPHHNLLAYSADFSGYETYTIRIRSDFGNGAELNDVIENCSGDILWGNDESTLFYMTMDEEHRPDKVYLHTLGTSQSEDICLLEEDDARYWMSMSKTSDEQFLILGAESKETSEYSFLSLQNILGGVEHRNQITSKRLQCLRHRVQGIRYENIEHYDGYFYMITNLSQAKNQKIMRIPVSYYSTTNASVNDEEDSEEEDADDDEDESDENSPPWEDIRPYSPTEQIDDLLVFEHAMAIFGRYHGIAALWIITNPHNAIHDWLLVSFPEADYSLSDGDNMEYKTNTLRLMYSSFLTPKQIIDYDLSTGQMVIRKEQVVPGDYDRNQYTSQRISALSRDGSTSIPMSIVYHKHANHSNDDQKLHHCPVLLYGYGSYGACIDPSFDFKRLSMLDRGVIYIIAHIRGGGELGRIWYEDEGKYFTKLNTFYDFIDCLYYLYQQEITTPSQCCIVGRSAGGLLIGSVVNLLLQEQQGKQQGEGESEGQQEKPKKWLQAAVADVPFVDVLTTMSDPSIPLTVTEWEEWGNPNEKEYFEYMSQYSPYDTIQANQTYPAMLITGGLHDPRVAYWEPAKWIAKLRDVTASSNNFYLKTDMSSGHFSASDRYKYISETAIEYAFILDQIKAKELVLLK